MLSIRQEQEEHTQHLSVQKSTEQRTLFPAIFSIEQCASMPPLAPQHIPSNGAPDDGLTRLHGNRQWTVLSCSFTRITIPCSSLHLLSILQFFRSRPPVTLFYSTAGLPSGDTSAGSIPLLRWSFCNSLRPGFGSR